MRALGRCPSSLSVARTMQPSDYGCLARGRRFGRRDDGPARGAGIRQMRTLSRSEEQRFMHRPPGSSELAGELQPVAIRLSSTIRGWAWRHTHRYLRALRL